MRGEAEVLENLFIPFLSCRRLRARATNEAEVGESSFDSGDRVLRPILASQKVKHRLELRSGIFTGRRLGVAPVTAHVLSTSVGAQAGGGKLLANNRADIGGGLTSRVNRDTGCDSRRMIRLAVTLERRNQTFERI